MSSPEKIHAFMVLDIIGRPADFLIESLEKHIDLMKNEKGVKIKEQKIREPVPMKENKDFFTTFAEVEVETDDIMYLASLMFKYMPAHVEVVSPERITLANTGWSEILSELTRKLHAYDEVARVIQAEREILLQKLKQLQDGKAPEKMTEEKVEKKANKKEKKK